MQQFALIASFIVCVFLVRLCRARAEGVKDQANSTRQALDVSEKAIMKAAEALIEAQANLNGTRNATAQVDLAHLATSEELSAVCMFPNLRLVPQVDERLTQLEDKQMDAMMRLVNLSAEVEALRNKTEQNRRMAKEATAQAANATRLASSLQQVSVGDTGAWFIPQLCCRRDVNSSFFPTVQGLNNTEEQYRKLQEKIGSLGGGGLGDINKKVMDMKKEAEGLLNKATKGMEQLRSE